MPAAQHTVTIHRPVEEVFDFVADGTTAPRWREGIHEIAHVSGSGDGARYRQVMSGPGGRRIEADYVITSFDRPRRFTFQTVAGPVRPRGDYRFEPTPDGTRVTFAIEADMGAIQRLVMGRMVQREMDNGVRALERLKAVLEA